MKLLSVSILSVFLSLSAFAEKTPCTVSISGEYTGEQVINQAKSELSDIGCTAVDSNQNPKYAINYGFIYDLCFLPTRAQKIEWDFLNLVAGTTNFEGTLKNVQTGVTLDNVSKTFWTPEFSHDCNLFNKFSDRGAAKVLRRFVKKIRTAEQAQ